MGERASRGTRRRLTAGAAAAAASVVGAAGLGACAWPARRGGAGDTFGQLAFGAVETGEPLTQLVVFPDDGISPLLRLLEGAGRQLDLYIFELHSPEIERRITDAVRRGVRVRAIVEPSPAGRVQQASQVMARLRRAGAHVKPAGRPFSKTHAKVVVADGAQAWVGTGNLVDAWRDRRDFAVATRRPETVRALSRLFDEDWLGASSALPAGTPRLALDPRAGVVASPQNGRNGVTSFLSGARRSLYLEHDQLDDVAVQEALAKRSREGVDVRVVLSEGDVGRRTARTLQLRAPAIQVRLLAAPEVHAKLAIADETRVLLGSHNLTKESLDTRREISLLLDEPHVVGGALEVFRRDFEGVLVGADGAEPKPAEVVGNRQPFMRGFLAGALLPGAAALVWALGGKRP